MGITSGHHTAAPVRTANRELGAEAVREGSIIAVTGAGAYGFSMSSNYNSRPRAAEVMVDGDREILIRRRETFEDLIRNEAEVSWTEKA